MGNRSKFLAVTAAVSAGVMARRRRNRLRVAAESIGDTILPSQARPVGAEEAPLSGLGHAPGHRHLARDDTAGRWRRRRAHGATGAGKWRPYAKD